MEFLHNRKNYRNTLIIELTELLGERHEWRKNFSKLDSEQVYQIWDSLHNLYELEGYIPILENLLKDKFRSINIKFQLIDCYIEYFTYSLHNQIDLENYKKYKIDLLNFYNDDFDNKNFTSDFIKYINQYSFWNSSAEIWALESNINSLYELKIRLLIGDEDDTINHFGVNEYKFKGREAGKRSFRLLLTDRNKENDIVILLQREGVLDDDSMWLNGLCSQKDAGALYKALTTLKLMNEGEVAEAYRAFVDKFKFNGSLKNFGQPSIKATDLYIEVLKSLASK